MNDEVHKEVYKGYTIRIIPDSDAQNLRTEYDTPFGTMVCFHGRYDLGDKGHGYTSKEQSSWDEFEERLVKDGAVVILPLYLYDHSGITMNTSGFSCPWDSGQVGFIFITREKLLKKYGGMRVSKDMIAKATRVMEGEVETYDQYLKGEVYGYTIEDPNGDDSDSCWGYYGDYDGEHGALAEAKSIVDHEVAAKFKGQFESSMLVTGMEE